MMSTFYSIQNLLELIIFYDSKYDLFLVNRIIKTEVKEFYKQHLGCLSEKIKEVLFSFILAIS